MTSETATDIVRTESWRQVDEGWGRQAATFATLSEPSNCREYVALHHHLDLDAGDRLLDVACGAGLALELGALRGATCAGIDASSRLLAVARDRLPDADLRLGDMHAMPWDDGAFDVVTSFRGIWGTTPDAVAEVHRVLRPGGRVGITVWGHLKQSPGAWALSPFRLASEPKVANQAAMVALGRPGAGEELLTRAGFADVRRVEIPFAWEFPDPEGYARALASSGPAYEAIQAVGEDAFLAHAVEVGRTRVRAGLPLRASIAVIAYLARKPAPARRPEQPAEPSRAGFLVEREPSPEVERLYDEDVEELGFVMNGTRLWAHQPELVDGLFELQGRARDAASLTTRQRGILITAMASTLGDSYCALAWGGRLADRAGPELAARVLEGDDSGLTELERALAGWARRVTRDPNGTGPDDVEALRQVGYDDAQILAITTFVTLRMAFSATNDALGAQPDRELAATAPSEVRDAVTYGRPVHATGSGLRPC
jgi:SAM-dependent methyltransferase/alkylhydroperoxidase family enzyme